jgi:hypothetical protein
VAHLGQIVLVIMIVSPFRVSILEQFNAFLPEAVVL